MTVKYKKKKSLPSAISPRDKEFACLSLFTERSAKQPHAGGVAVSVSARLKSDFFFVGDLFKRCARAFYIKMK